MSGGRGNPRPPVECPAWARWTWASIFGAAFGVEGYALLVRPSSRASLSQTTRWVFHTNTRPGQVAFAGGWLLLTWWFLPHVVRATAVAAADAATAAVDAAVDAAVAAATTQPTPQPAPAGSHRWGAP